MPDVYDEKRLKRVLSAVKCQCRRSRSTVEGGNSGAVAESVALVAAPAAVEGAADGSRRQDGRRQSKTGAGDDRGRRQNGATETFGRSQRQ